KTPTQETDLLRKGVIMKPLSVEDATSLSVRAASYFCVECNDRLCIVRKPTFPRVDGTEIMPTDQLVTNESTQDIAMIQKKRL
ncbi:hypothetical protein BaRGS_00027933, partial [Batillaria attramentaria]